MKGEMRTFHRYGKRHLLKIIMGSSAMLALVTLLMVSNNGSIEVIYDIPFMKVDSSNPLIIVITPTYRRPTRLADLTRMANTLQQIPDLYWIVVEDALEKVKHVERILIRTRLPYTYLSVKTIPGYPKRGWYQRTVALNFLRNETQVILNGKTKGVVYFGDDDNSYDIRLFTDYIRNVRKLGLWAVGMVGGAPVESLNVINGSVVGFKVKWNPKRKFAVDMAGFAVHLDIVLNSTAVFGTSCSRGAGAPETCLLEDMGLTREDIEPFGFEKENDKDILVWHTKTQQPKYTKNKVDIDGYNIEEV